MSKTMKRICLQAFIGMITAWTAVSCSSEPAACGCGDDGSTIPVSFTMNTPAGEAVPYGTTRATHDEAEWTIHRLTLYVYSVDDAGRGLSCAAMPRMRRAIRPSASSRTAPEPTISH